MKVFLAGEGSDDLGEWVQPPQYRDPSRGLGVIEALMLRIAPSGWSVAGAVQWKKIHHYKWGEFRSREQRNVLGAALDATEAGCDALVFARDRDRDSDRGDDIEKALAELPTLFPRLRAAGGVAIEEVEAWLLALKGERGSERHADAKAVLAETGVDSRAAKVALIEASNVNAIPEDATSLAGWRDRVRSLGTN